MLLLLLTLVALFQHIGHSQTKIETTTSTGSVSVVAVSSRPNSSTTSWCNATVDTQGFVNAPQSRQGAPSGDKTSLEIEHGKSGEDAVEMRSLPTSCQGFTALLSQLRWMVGRYGRSSLRSPGQRGTEMGVKLAMDRWCQRSTEITAQKKFKRSRTFSTTNAGQRSPERRQRWWKARSQGQRRQRSTFPFWPSSIHAVWIYNSLAHHGLLTIPIAYCGITAGHIGDTRSDYGCCYSWGSRVGPGFEESLSRCRLHALWDQGGIGESGSQRCTSSDKRLARCNDCPRQSQEISPRSCRIQEITSLLG